MKYINVVGLDSKEALIKFLEFHGIEVKLVDYNEYDFSRTLEFMVYDQVYNILWFQNESVLKIGNSKRSPQVTFKHVFFNTTYPLIGGNKCLIFSFDTVESTMFGTEPSYSDFKIPLEIN